jgi:L-asparaginase
MSKNSNSSILIIYTGGTIGMREDPKTRTLIPVKFENIQDEIPELHKLGYNLSSISFDPPIDSSDVGPGVWGKIAKTIEEHYTKNDGFVILHGTDTMAYTASALSYMFENLGKPVVLTGSQLPIGVLRTDGKENIITAIEIAAARKDGQALVPEVCIYFSSFLFRGNRATKEDSEKFSAFASHNYPILATAGVGINYKSEYINKPLAKGILKTNIVFDDNVMILKLFPGISRKHFETMLGMPGFKGILLESYGAGNVPTFGWMLDAIRKAVERGVIIMNVTQCPGGRVQMGYYQSSMELIGAGVVSGDDITIEAAVTKMMFLLGQGLKADDTKVYLRQSLRGEMTK